MDDFLARAEIYEASTNLDLAKDCLAMGKISEALNALGDAERHYRSARDAVATEQSGPVVDSLVSLKSELGCVRSAIKSKL